MYQIQTHTKFNETESCIGSQVHFLVESRMDDFSVIWGVRLDAQTLVLLLFGAEFYLSSSSSTNIGFIGLAEVDPMRKSSKMDGEIGVSISGR